MIRNHKDEYYRKLLHFQPEGAVFSITFRLANSLPSNVLKDLKQERIHSLISDKEYFEYIDRVLRQSKSCENYLENPRIAEIVKSSIHHLEESDYDLICYCIMPNHVHLIIENCKRQLFKILQSLKRYTARESNKVLDREGAFWQKESYDHIVKDDDELEDSIVYVLNNPVEAGLVKDWKDWPYSYCKPDLNPLL
jgi:putative transposase